MYSIPIQRMFLRFQKLNSEHSEASETRNGNNFAAEPNTEIFILLQKRKINDLPQLQCGLYIGIRKFV